MRRNAPEIKISKYEVSFQSFSMNPLASVYLKIEVKAKYKQNGVFEEFLKQSLVIMALFKGINRRNDEILRF